MKLLKAEIKNYKSLRNVEIEFGNLTIFIGQNSSGKSNCLEALYHFFNEFDPTPQRVVTNVTNELWTEKETENPIEIAITFKLTKKEFETLFDKSTITSTGIELGDRILKVCREINFKPPTNAFWRTSQVTMNGVPVIFDGVVIKEANIGETAMTVGGTITTTKTLLPDSLRQTISNKTLQKLHEMFKQSFKLIPTARNNLGSPPKLGKRESNIPVEIEKQIVATCDSEEVPDTKVWDNVEKDINEISSLRRLNIRANSLRCREGILRFPLSYTGGGDQELLMTSFLLRKGDFDFLGIEEPETHLHPHLARKLFSILEEVSNKKQTMITTHSPIFVDLANLKNSWIFRKENRETKVYRIERSDDLQIISYELGVRPSDVFLADKILFVEGRIDKRVYRIWADKLGIDLKSPLLSIIALGGKTEGKRHLEAWMKVTKNIPVSVSIILDKDAKTEAEKLVADNFASPDQISVLKNGAIEDYYDADVLIQVMNSRYGKQFTKEDLKPSQSEGLKKILANQHKSKRERSRAKLQIGIEVANKMTQRQIHDEIRTTLEKTRKNLKLLQH